METEDYHTAVHIPLHSINDDCGHTNVQTISRHQCWEELSSFNPFHDWRAYLVQYSAPTIGTFHTGQSSEALWCDFLVTTVAYVDHKISPLEVRPSEPNRAAFLRRTQLMKVFLWWCPDPIAGLFQAVYHLLRDRYSILS